MNAIKFFTAGMLFFALSFFSFSSSFAVGLPNEGLQKSEIIEAMFEAKISAEDFVPVGKAVLFDGSTSKLLDTKEFGEARFYWDFHNDQPRKLGKEQIYTFKNPGKKRITLIIQQGEKTIEAEKEIFVYGKTALFMNDTLDVSGLKGIERSAAENGVLLRSLPLLSGDTERFLVSEKAVKLFSENTGFIKDANTLIFNTESIDSLSSFVQYYQSLKDENKFDVSQKLFVVIANSNFQILKPLIERSRLTLNVPFILLTRKEALNPIFESPTTGGLLTTLKQRGVEQLIVDARIEKSKIFIFSYLVSFFISSGIPSSTLYLLLVFPFIAFFVTFARQFIGISTYGVYLPVMLSLTFFLLGMWFTFMVLTLVLLLSIFIRYILEKVEMLYIPKVALTLSIIASSFFIIIWASLVMELPVAVSLVIFPMLVISTISEKFLSLQSLEGLSSAIIVMIETIVVSFVTYTIIDLTVFKNLIMALPELILLPFLGIIVLGKFTGLRLTEYFKFRSLIWKDLGE